MISSSGLREFKNSRVLVLGSNSMMANVNWNKPLDLGTNNAVFVENCTFFRTKFGNSVDSNYGSRYVFRYNKVNNSYLEAHSVQSTKNRGARSWEFYNNYIKRDDTSFICNNPFSLRAGTGVVFNNKIIGKWGFLNHGYKAIALDLKRNIGNLDSILCDGKTEFSQVWDGDGTNINGDMVGGPGYPCRDQPGTSVDAFVWEGDPNESGEAKWINKEYPAPRQKVDPVCEWNNKYYVDDESAENEIDGNDIDFVVVNDPHMLKQIQEGRDFKNDTVRDGYISYPYPHPYVKLDSDTEQE